MPDVRFVRHGGFLGAIGAMMADAMKPITNDDEVNVAAHEGRRSIRI